MCDHCGCGQPEPTADTTRIKIEERITRDNERVAQSNRRWFEKYGVIAINIIGSPGSGKTTLIERTIDHFKDKYRIAVLEGDIETDIDAQRIRNKGIPAVQLTTGGACHLDAELVHKGFHELVGNTKDENNYPHLLFIENVGNLVCPASFDLGETLRVVLVSVPEGEDKPLKYPKAFRTSHVFIITKIDLASAFDFSIEKVKKYALRLNPTIKIFSISSKTGNGLKQWFDFVEQIRTNL